MIGEWQLTQGNEMPEPFSIRDDIYAVMTRNVEQIDEDLFQYEEFILKKEDYYQIIGSTDNSFGEINNALMELYEMMIGA